MLPLQTCFALFIPFKGVLLLCFVWRAGPPTSKCSGAEPGLLDHWFFWFQSLRSKKGFNYRGPSVIRSEVFSTAYSPLPVVELADPAGISDSKIYCFLKNQTFHFKITALIQAEMGTRFSLSQLKRKQ